MFCALCFGGSGYRVLGLALLGFRVQGFGFVLWWVRFRFLGFVLGV